jgi:hypothetical protein
MCQTLKVMYKQASLGGEKKALKPNTKTTTKLLWKFSF